MLSFHIFNRTHGHANVLYVLKYVYVAGSLCSPTRPLIHSPILFTIVHSRLFPVLITSLHLMYVCVCAARAFIVIAGYNFHVITWNLFSRPLFAFCFKCVFLFLLAVCVCGARSIWCNESNFVPNIFSLSQPHKKHKHKQTKHIAHISLCAGLCVFCFVLFCCCFCWAIVVRFHL